MSETTVNKRITAKLTLEGLKLAAADLGELYMTQLELRFHPESSNLPMLQELFAHYSIADLEALKVRVVKDYHMPLGMIHLGELENFRETGKIGYAKTTIYDMRESNGQ